MVGLNLLEENWNKIRDRVILPLWNGKFKTMYESVKLDYDDFESLAGIELSKAIKAFNPDKSNLFTYSTRVVSQKALTELRNCTQRDKRKVSHMSESFETLDCSEIADSKTTVDGGNQEISELSELRVGNFVNSLDNNQLRILILTLLEFDMSDMPVMLNISNQTVQSIVRSLKDADLTRILYRRKF